MNIDGAATLGFSAFDFETAVSCLAGLGFSRIELSHMSEFCTHLVYQQTSVREVADVTARYDMQVLSMNLAPCWLRGGKAIWFDYTQKNDRDECIAQGRWYLETARELDVPVVTWSTARRAFGDKWARQMHPACETYRAIADIAQQFDISLHLEVPHLFQITDTVEHVAEIFDRIDHPAVGATVDSSHWGIIGYDLDVFFQMLGPRLRHVHLRDSAGPDTKDGKQQLEMTPGQGVVDFTHFREALKRAGYDANVTLDFEYRGADLEQIRNEYREGLRVLSKHGWDFDPHGH